MSLDSRVAGPDMYHVRSVYIRTPYASVSQPPGRGPVPVPGINYTGPREILLEFVILVF